MTPTTKIHDLSYVEDVTREFRATVNGDGDIVPYGVADILDVHESSIWCSTCGRLGYDEYENHGISEDWQVM